MKKYLAIALTASFILTFAGCSNGANNSSQSSSSNSSSSNSSSSNSSSSNSSSSNSSSSNSSSSNSSSSNSSSNNSSSSNSSSSNSSSSKTDNNSTDKPDENKTITPAEVEAAIAKALGEGYLCTADVPEDEINLSCIGWLDGSKIESYVLKKPTIYCQDIVAVVKCKEGYADEAVQILNKYFAQTISYIRQYPFDVAKVEGTRIFKFGDIVMYITAGAAASGEMSAEDEAKLAASEYEKIDGAIKELFGTSTKNLAVITEPDNGGNGGFDFDDFVIGG